MREEEVHYDIAVIGGGLAGTCAAIAAARLGRRVALVNNRPVLGGNASSEIRVWVCGATAHGVHRWARETGIMGELYTENQYRNPEGNPYYWDQVVLDAVRAEPNIDLYLNTDVREVDASGPDDSRQVHSCTGWMMGSERRITFHAHQFLDCTGDGLLGHLAGAHYRIGREAQAEFDEPWAPVEADRALLGSTILFHSRDTGAPAKFVPPAYAKDLSTTPILRNRILRTGDNGCDYWWVEWGGELDTVHDNERIRDELQSVIMGIWDHIKNSGEFPDAANLTLEWVGSLPGKREYRRFLGDHVLTQQDILQQRQFSDRIAFGGWSVDLHPVQGMYADEPGARQRYADGIFHIPLRSLYSANVTNLHFAGRNISATHIAFGATRVMATCATLGEAAGTAAALCVTEGLTPRELATKQPELVRRTLLRQDASVIGVADDDPGNLARTARVSASSHLARLAAEPTEGAPGAPYPLTRDLALLLPVDPALDTVDLLVHGAPDGRDRELTVELWGTGNPENAVPADPLLTTTVTVPSGGPHWVTARLDHRPDTPGTRSSSSGPARTRPWSCSPNAPTASSPCAGRPKGTRPSTTTSRRRTASWSWNGRPAACAARPSPSGRPPPPRRSTPNGPWADTNDPTADRTCGPPRRRAPRSGSVSTGRKSRNSPRHAWCSTTTSTSTSTTCTATAPRTRSCRNSCATTASRARTPRGCGTHS